MGVAGDHHIHPGGGFNPPEPTTKGGPDYGRFIDGVRKMQDHARAVDAPDGVITEAADLLEKVSALLSPFDADEWESPSGRRMDLPVRGNILTIPMAVRKAPREGEAGRIQGSARFARFHLGRNGAVHGGALGMLFDTVLGLTSSLLTGGPRQRTAYLTINYRHIVPIEKETADRRGDRPGGGAQDLRLGPAERRRHPADRSRRVVRAAQARPAVRLSVESRPDSIATANPTQPTPGDPIR